MILYTQKVWFGNSHSIIFGRRYTEYLLIVQSSFLQYYLHETSDRDLGIIHEMHFTLGIWLFPLWLLMKRMPLF